MASTPSPTSLVDAIQSATSIIASAAPILTSAASAIINATSTLLDDSPHPSAIINGTTPSTLEPGDPLESGNYVLNTFIGLVVVLAASALNAFGLNITKLDHTRQQTLPRRERKPEWMRPIWLAGMGMYIVSQLVGSTLALKWLRPDWVAPLGSTSLIFNFLFASWLVGTPVTKTDINGTAVIILGVILILVFSSINHGLQQGLNIQRLNSLWTRIDWLVYFAFLILFTSSTYFASSILARLLASRASFSPLPSPTMELNTAARAKPSHPIIGFFKRCWASWRRVDDFVLRQVEVILRRAEDPRVTWLQGIGWAVCGGSLAGMCLVFTKAVVSLLGRKDHPFYNVSAIITLLCVLSTAILQIVCLNRALECADTVVVVPLFYAGYTVFGFINSLIFYDEAGQYERWVLISVFASIGVLVSGVTILSLKSSAKHAPDPYTPTDPNSSMRMRPRMPRGRPETPGDGEEFGDEDDGAGGSSSKAAEEGRSRNTRTRGRRGEGEEGEVMWEVGSISDSDDDDDDDGEEGKDGGDKRKGIGGGNVRGERRGLLLDEDEERDGEGVSPTVAMIDVPREAERNPFADSSDMEDGYGEFEAVGPSSSSSPRNPIRTSGESAK